MKLAVCSTNTFTFLFLQYFYFHNDRTYHHRQVHRLAVQRPNWRGCLQLKAWTKIHCCCHLSRMVSRMWRRTRTRGSNRRRRRRRGEGWGRRRRWGRPARRSCSVFYSRAVLRADCHHYFWSAYNQKWLILASYWFSSTLSEKSTWPRLCLFLVEKSRIILFLVLLTIKDSPCQADLTDH